MAIDPGRNIGVAFVSRLGRLERASVITIAELARLDFPEGATILVGDGTGSQDVQAALRRLGRSYTIWPERDTSRQGRELYLRDHPPRGLARLLPRGLRAPSVPIDAYAAYALALHYLEKPL